MMPKKAKYDLRDQLIGVKVNEETKIKINWLAGMNGEKAGTYIYNILQKHLEEKEPWLTKEINQLTEEQRKKLLKTAQIEITMKGEI